MAAVHTPALSFVIPVRDDARQLEKCLASICANEGATQGVEIVVVDNGSRDDSIAVAERLGARVIEAPGIRVAALRNMGAATCRAPIIAFVDADHVLGAGWID